MDVRGYMLERKPLVERVLEAALPSADAAPVRLHAAMRHLVFPGGKRLRPMLAIAAAEAVGAPPERALPVAAAVELIHNYSLIHDDLPCMDDDDVRRGRPTVHRAFDEATAVLAGDALLTEAFAALSVGGDAAGAAARLEVVRLLAHSAGALGLVGGQVDDLGFAAEGTDATLLASIHARKTAALFRASILGGAILAGANADQRDALEAFAEDVGIGFQIADDVLDSESGEAASILRVQGMEDAKQGAEGLLERALGQIDGWGEAAEPLRSLARFAIRRER